MGVRVRTIAKTILGNVTTHDKYPDATRWHVESGSIAGPADQPRALTVLAEVDGKPKPIAHYEPGTWNHVERWEPEPQDRPADADDSHATPEPDKNTPDDGVKAAETPVQPHTRKVKDTGWRGVRYRRQIGDAWLDVDESTPGWRWSAMVGDDYRSGSEKYRTDALAKAEEAHRAMKSTTETDTGTDTSAHKFQTDEKLRGIKVGIDWGEKCVPLTYAAAVRVVAALDKAGYQIVRKP